MNCDAVYLVLEHADLTPAHTRRRLSRTDGPKSARLGRAGRSTGTGREFCAAHRNQFKMKQAHPESSIGLAGHDYPQPGDRRTFPWAGGDLSTAPMWHRNVLDRSVVGTQAGRAGYQRQRTRFEPRLRHGGASEGADGMAYRLKSLRMRGCQAASRNSLCASLRRVSRCLPSEASSAKTSSQDCPRR